MQRRRVRELNKFEQIDGEAVDWATEDNEDAEPEQGYGMPGPSNLARCGCLSTFSSIRARLRGPNSSCLRPRPPLTWVPALPMSR
ncbi:hypothetical protein WSS_A38271 [Rhodococcus opacus M213]|uniref:Uncharacterized protein n=1 Tax=Rhodococcus opacus M213 TaxID=1129896 RepID=K8XJS0_RHOOP|nr:hypothetical protein [Rhodococcus opacus]EKT77330.1 hypothetical protein WSS_A38271 [Rhodococcus opacus M213]